MKNILQLTFILLIINCYSSVQVTAQVAINTDNSAPDASAMLDVKSTDKGVLIPRMTSAQRTAIMSAATGLLVFDSTTESFWFKNSTAWEELNTISDRIVSPNTNWQTIATNSKVRMLNLFSERFAFSANTMNIDAGSYANFGNSQSIRFIDGSNNNHIRSHFPPAINGATDSEYFMEFKVKDKKPLILKGDGRVEVNESYSLPNAGGVKGHVMRYFDGDNANWGYNTLLADDDGDTRVVVDEDELDEDQVRFDLAGQERLLLRKNTNGNTMLEFKNSSNGNLFIGNNAGNANTGDNNVFVGGSAGSNNTSGDNNTCMGIRAGGDNQTGSSNTFVGAYAGTYSTGSFNTFIGQGAGANETGSYKLYIANDGTSLPLIYGEFDNDLVEINGAGSGNSYFPFTVKNNGNPSNFRANGLRVIAGQNSESAGSRFFACITPDGDEIGSIRQNGNSTVNFDTNSDIRLKTNIKPTHLGLHELLQIEVRDYDFKSELGRMRTGFIAQQLYEHYPEAVTVGGEDEKKDAWGVDYGKLTPLLVKAVQDQQAIIEAQQTEIAKLKTLEAEVAQIKAMLQASTNVETAKAER